MKARERSSLPAPPSSVPEPELPVPARVSTSRRHALQDSMIPTRVSATKIARQSDSSIRIAPTVGASIGATTIAMVR